MKRVRKAMACFFVLMVLNGCGKGAKARTFNQKQYEYHDGVAWVQLKEQHLFHTEYLGVVCIDESGREIFCMPEVNLSQVSNFYDGVALVQGQYLMNKSGEFMHDLKAELGVHGIVMFGDNYFDGYIFVEEYTNGVQMTGVLDRDLNWLIEPTSRLNKTEPKGNYLYYSSLEGYYDAKRNEFIDEETFRDRHFQRCFPQSGLIFLSRNGNNSFNYSLGTESGTVWLDESCRTGFYNTNLEMVIDLSYYPSIQPLSDFKQGKCLMSFTTAQGKTYTGLMNMNGEFLFIETGYIENDGEIIKFKRGNFDWNGNFFES